ncbi:DUF4232 domain-containing protein [Streptomyces sp. G45]|uniref:DUF4232 domain-containing protein n=1 Tax=Streptomyces sp. G45 TaxID=3406627 RepID=UPI003C277025
MTLRRGESATAVVVWRNTYTDTTKAPVKGEHLKVVPVPGGPARTVTPYGGVDLGSTGRLGVTAWRKAPPKKPRRPLPTPPPATAPAPSTPAR